jgi:hypothetical protein
MIEAADSRTMLFGDVSRTCEPRLCDVRPQVSLSHETSQVSRS